MTSTQAQRDEVRALWDISIPPVEEPTIEDWRIQYDRFFERFPQPGDAIVEEVDAGGVPALWVSAPGVRDDIALMHFHSGGYVIGRAGHYREFGYRLSRAADAPVLIPDYRLAPEHLYPAAQEDALTAYRWLVERVPASQVVTVGDSAGGALNLALLVQVRDAGEELPAAAVCISPWIDLAAEGDSYRFNDASDPYQSAEQTRATGQVYLDGRDPKQTPLGSPLYADFDGIPPTQVFVGGAEVLLSDAQRLVERLGEAGVPAGLTVGEGLLHIYPLFAHLLPEGQEAIDDIGEFARRHTDAAAPTPDRHA